MAATEKLSGTSELVPAASVLPSIDGGPPRVMQLGKGRQQFQWIDYSSPNPEQIDELAHTYHFHPLTIEDVKSFNERAKLQDFGDYLFMSLHTLGVGEDGVEDREVEVFLGRNYLITIHREPSPILESVHDRFERDTRRIELGPDYLLYVIVDGMVDSIFPILDKFDNDIDELEDAVIDNASPQTLQRIFHIKRDLIQMRRSVTPMRDLMNALASTRYSLIDAQTALYYRDVYDHLSRIYELIETQRDLIGNSLDVYLSVVSNRLNEVVKRLTLIATIFLPISFIVGLGGINFQHMPFDNQVAFWILIASLVIVPLGMILYFRAKRWF